MEFIVPKKRLTKLRIWLIKNRIVKPKDVNEIREAFPFPYEVKQTRPKFGELWASRHIEKLGHRRYN